MGKSSILAVASAAPIPAAAAAIRQSAWCKVTPREANDLRHVPARLPSATPSGASRSPLNSRRACDSSPGSSPRHTSSTETAQAQGSVPVRRSPATRAAAGRPRERVDQHGRVEEQAGHRHPERRSSPPSLPAHPRRRVVVPFVPGIGQTAERGFDVVPATFILEPTLDQLRDEGAPSPCAGTPVQLGYQSVIQRYMYAHGPKLAHTTAHFDGKGGGQERDSHDERPIHSGPAGPCHVAQVQRRKPPFGGLYWHGRGTQGAQRREEAREARRRSEHTQEERRVGAWVSETQWSRCWQG